MTVDPKRAKFTIDEQKRGVMINWAQLLDLNIHFEPLYIVIWPIEYGFKVDINLKIAKLISSAIPIINDYLFLKSPNHSQQI